MEKTNAKDAEPRKINIAKIFPMEGSVLLDESGIHSGLVQKHHDMIHNPNLWHRINASITTIAKVIFVIMHDFRYWTVNTTSAMRY